MQTAGLFNLYLVAGFFYLHIFVLVMYEMLLIETALTLQVVRPTLMPGLLRTVGHNKDHPKPIKVNEDN